MAEKKLDAPTLSSFCGSICMMLHSGIGAEEACGLFAADQDSALSGAAAAVGEAMSRGSSFADAAKESGVFPEYALRVFAVSEYSGRLEEGLDRLADYYDRQNSFLQRLRSTLVYPAVLMLMMCIVLAVLTFFVLPMFSSVYAGLTGSLAASSYAYVLAAEVIARVSLAVTAILSACMLAAAAAAKTEAGRQRLLRRMETLALTRQALRELALSRLADTLSVLLSSGLDADSAMSEAQEMTEHSALRAELQQCAEQMQAGAGLAETLYRSGTVPALYGRMLVGGARSGSLEKVLEEVSVRLSRDAENALTGLMDSMEPLLIGFLAAAVGLTLLSVMLPLLGMLGAV